MGSYSTASGFLGSPQRFESSPGFSVTMQRGLWPLVTMIHDPKICVEGNRFLLTGFQLWGCGGWESSCSESPFLPQDPEFLLLPKRLITSQKFSISLSILSELTLASQTDLPPLWNVHVWVSELPSPYSSSLCQGPGCAALSLRVAVQDPVPCSTGSQCPGGRSSGRPASQHRTLPPGVGFYPCRA